jgi:hypothetical protein
LVVPGFIIAFLLPFRNVKLLCLTRDFGTVKIIPAADPYVIHLPVFIAVFSGK